LPSSFRITTRTFEDPELGQRKVLNGEELVIVSDGHDGVAVSFQGETVTVKRSSNSPEGPIAPEAVRSAVESGVQAIGRFVATQGFQRTLAELSKYLPMSGPGSLVKNF